MIFYLTVKGLLCIFIHSFYFCMPCCNRLEYSYAGEVRLASWKMLFPTNIPGLGLLGKQELHSK